MEISFYFYKLYHSWERGANENTNGLIRQYIPKGTDFSEITDEFVTWVENKLNNRPRKRLGYLTPNEKAVSKILRKRENRIRMYLTISEFCFQI